ncbi:MAG: replication protein [Planctomycetota bacterium]|jgi:phage replication O-like protein O
MANPQAENGHVKIANEIVQQLARVNLPAYEWRVLWAVLRKTWGWRKKADAVPLSQIVQMTGLRQPHVSRAKASLLKKQILFEQAGKVGFQKNYELWTAKGFIYTNSGMKTHTDSGIKTTESYTDSGLSHTDSGINPIPNQGDSKATKATTQKQQRAEVAKPFREYWNSKTNLPRIKSMTPDRRTKLRTRMKEPDFADNWQEIVDRISASSFCTGGGEKKWRAGVDWLLGNSSNYVKVLEGKYDDEGTPKPLERGPDGLTPREHELKRIGAT